MDYFSVEFLGACVQDRDGGRISTLPLSIVGATAGGHAEQW